MADTEVLKAYRKGLLAYDENLQRKTKDFKEYCESAGIDSKTNVKLLTRMEMHEMVCYLVGAVNEEIKAINIANAQELTRKKEEREERRKARNEREHDAFRWMMENNSNRFGGEGL